MTRSSKKSRSRANRHPQQQRDAAPPTADSFPAVQDARGFSSPRPAAHDVYAVLAVCGFLLLAVWLVFGRTLNYGFVNFDDNEYVYENSHIIQGPIAAKIGWAFTSTYANNWHPLTWFSHILDYELYGLNAGGHHATNVLLHAATAILLFLVLRRMTGDLWPSAFVAAIFAIHPLRVESVAWVSERKDVLSGLFFMLTLLAYVGYVRCPFSLVRYLAVMALFALGLMAKPMLVTLPFILLLLDYWPLGRVHTKPRPSCWGGSCTATPEATVQLSPQQRSVASSGVMDDLGLSKGATAGRGLMANVWFLVLEKIPLFVLAAAACVATTMAQSSLVMGLTVLPLSARISNVPLSYVAYLGQFFYPVGLAAFYPYPWPNLPVWKVAAALLALVAISIAVLAWRRRRPAVLVGWFWYLGMLVPVIGLVQVASQAMADRYTYLPQIGLCIALAWGASQAVASWPHRRWVCGAGSALVLAILMVCAWQQTIYWRNSVALWSHTLDCISWNSLPLRRLGDALADSERFDEAIAQYRKALERNPNYVAAHYNLGVVLMNQGRIDEAIEHFRKALRIRPDANSHNNLGAALANRKQFDEAIEHYRAALEINPNYAEAHNNLGASLMSQGRIDQAIEHYEAALRIKPDYADAHYNLSVALARRGRTDETIEHYRAALKIKPDYADAHYNLGVLLASRGRTDEAIEHFQAALKIKPDDANLHDDLGVALVGRGRIGEAIEHFRKALRIKPDDSLALNNLAWLRATYPESSFRDGAEGVALAQRALQLSDGREPTIYDTLAAAYAEAGRFPEAVQTARKALKLAEQQRNEALAKSVKARIRLYESGTPYRESPLSSTMPATQP